jgi:hypothetical protein
VVKASIYIPDELSEYVKNHLADYPEKTLSSLIQELLEAKLKPKKNKLLDLIGFVSSERLANRTEEEWAALERQRDQEARQFSMPLKKEGR